MIASLAVAAILYGPTAPPPDLGMEGRALVCSRATAFPWTRLRTQLAFQRCLSRVTT